MFIILLDISYYFPFEFNLPVGIALALIAYPQAIAKLPSPHVWAIIFFIMLMTLGMDSMVGYRIDLNRNLLKNSSRFCK